MKLKDYVAKLSKLAEKYPDVEVYQATDSEGNGFYMATSPTVDVFAEKPLGYSMENVVDGDDLEAYEENELERICLL